MWCWCGGDSTSGGNFGGDRDVCGNGTEGYVHDANIDTYSGFYGNDCDHCDGEYHDDYAAGVNDDDEIIMTLLDKDMMVK